MIRFVGSVDGITELDRAFNRIDEYISDFRSIWPAVTKEFYSIEEEQFASEGAHGTSGKWAALSPAYTQWKAKEFPGEPILQREHSLYESLTSPNGLASIFRPERDQLTIGSSEPYALAHQRGGRLPRRPPISLTSNDKRRMQKAIQIGLVKFTRQAGFKVNEGLAA